MFNLSKTRKLKGLTQQQLATKSGLSQEYICRLEKGKCINPSIETLIKIAKALEIPVATLLAQNTK